MHFKISILETFKYSASVIYYLSIAYFWFKDKVKGRPS